MYLITQILVLVAMTARNNITAHNITAHNITAHITAVTTTSMPRTSEKTQILKDIDATIEVAEYAYLLASDEAEEKEMEELEEIEEHIQDLLQTPEERTSPLQYLVD